MNKYYENNNHYYGEGMEVNTEILPPTLQSFYKLATCGKFEQINGNKEGAENIYNWFRAKIIGTYKAKDLELRKIIHSKISDKKRLFKNFKSDYILTKQIEYALEDLFQVLFANSDVKIFKTSEYDDIMGGIDYIVVSNNCTFGIDLKLRAKMQNESTQDNEEYFLLEYNLYNNKKYEIKENRGNKAIKILDKNKIKVSKKNLIFEPNLAQLYLKHYLEIIKNQGYDIGLKNDIVSQAWEKATAEYENYSGIVSQNTGMNYKNVLQVVQTASQDLFSNLIQGKTLQEEI